MGKLALTPKGKKYLEEQEAKRPEMAALRKKIREDVLPNLPTDRKELIKAVYDTSAAEHTKDGQ